MSILSDNEKRRYARHILLPEVGSAGQLKLKNAKVLIIGAGGLGSPIALYLAAAGIGTIGVIDADVVDLSNLQRQIIYTTTDIGCAKTDAAKTKILAINPYINVIAYNQQFTATNAFEIINDYDVIIDGTDTFDAHYLINDACVISGKPLVYGNVHRFIGQVATILPHKSACYRCLYPSQPPPEHTPSCSEAGVLGVVPGLIGILQATETLKLVLAIGEPIVGRCLRFDAIDSRFKEIILLRDPECAICGDNPSIKELHMTTTDNQSCGAIPSITAAELKNLLGSDSKPFLLDVRNLDEYEQAYIEGAKLIPLPELPTRLSELNPQDDIVIYCRSGRRSAKALEILRQHGFNKLRNLASGIEGYL